MIALLRLFFSDRGWILKAALAAGLLASLGWRSYREYSGRLPLLEPAAVIPETFEGKNLYLWAKRVIATTPDGFEIQTKAGPFRVTSTERPAPGGYVTFDARVIGPRRLAAGKVRIMDGYVWKRSLTYGVSILAVAVFLWMARRHFQGRLSQGLFRSRY